MRPWGFAAGAAGLGLMLALVMRLPGLSDHAISLVSDLGQLGAAIAASAGCVVAARRSVGQRRRAWLWIAAGTSAWAAGQSVWSWYELVLDQQVPFPSAADVGFLLAPVGMTIGLVTWLGSQGDQLVARGRDVLDGAVIAASLLVLSWVTVMGSVAEAGDAWLPLTLSLAYPIGDLIVATLVLLAVCRGRRHEQVTLVILGLGLGGLAVADSSYLYLTGIGAYSSADTVSNGWIVGFLMVAAAGLGSARPQLESVPAPASAEARTSPAQSSLVRLLLPYVPLLAAGAVLVTSLLRSTSTARLPVLFGLALVILVLARQFLGMLDNRRLLTALGTVRDQLQHQATHDGLTGLANRDLFATRLQHALAQPAADVSVLFCDLDDFKLVNDRYGHDVGDGVLSVVAQRLLQCVRAGDTVARLGGDEFAILVESDQAVRVAERVVELLNQPVELQGQLLSTSASIGIAHHSGVQALLTPPMGHLEVAVTGRTVRAAQAPPLQARAERAALATLMLREADTAMYAAKDAGKGRAVLAALPPVALPPVAL